MNPACQGENGEEAMPASPFLRCALGLSASVRVSAQAFARFLRGERMGGCTDACMGACVQEHVWRIRMRNAKVVCSVCALVIGAVLLGGCGEKPQPMPPATPVPGPSVEATLPPASAATPTSTPAPSPMATPDPTVDSSFLLPDGTLRPTAVMIDNEGERPLPQAGLRQAQIIYEVLTEYRITRYLAFFWGSLPEMAGPVRSSRHYFLDWSMEYDAVYVHYGYSPQAMKDIPKLKIQNINGLVHGDAFWDTDPNPGNWQDSFTSAERVEAQVTSRKLRTEPAQPFPFTYAEAFAIPQEGESAVQVNLTYGKGFAAAYAYDEKTGLYARFRNGEPQMERNTGLQVAPRNILIQVVPSAAIAGDDKDRINVATVGKGSGWFLTGGKVRTLTWEKKARDAQTTYRLDGGEALVLNPGQTWIQVVPTEKTVEMLASLPE